MSTTLGVASLPAPGHDRRVPRIQSAADRAYDAIRAAILDGTHRPGSMLSENELAEGLGMSRTPIRAALVRLQDDGCITIYPKRGALVRELSSREIADLMDARLILETMGVQRAGSSVRRSLADRLEAELPDQRDALSRRDLDRFIGLAISFHQSFIAASGNALLTEIGDRLADRQRLLLSAHRELLFQRVDETIEEHRALVERLRADDPVGFAEALRTHVMGTLGSEVGPV